MEYNEFLKSKEKIISPVGFDISEAKLNPMLFDWQRKITQWALKRGRSALFEDCGLGKTAQQLEWANQVHLHTGRPVLILTPLAVAGQTLKEATKFNIPGVSLSKDGIIESSIVISNYERLHYFNPESFGGIVLDESSILKSFDGETRKELQTFAETIHFRLACSATPAPNDLIELINHAEFLNIMTGKEIIALFFKQDGNTTHKWKLKGHAEEDFWKWMAKWSIAIRKPSDIGFSDDGFILPKLTIEQITLENLQNNTGSFFTDEAQTLLERRQARRNSLPDRVRVASENANASKGQVLVWCDLNSESEALAESITDSVEVRGSDSPEHKEKSLLGFAEKKIKCLVSKPSIAGFGMNFQACNEMIFVGLSDSYEQFYQAVRRCWRFGQKRPVRALVITAEAEGAVVKNIKRKEKQAMEMFDNIVRHMKKYEEINNSKMDTMEYGKGIKMQLPLFLQSTKGNK